MQKILIFLMLSLFAATSMAAENMDSVIPNIESIYDQEKIGQAYTSQGRQALVAYIDSEIGYHKKFEKGQDGYKTAKDVMPFYEYAQALLKKTSSADEDMSYLLAKRVLSSTLTMDLERTQKRYPQAFQQSVDLQPGEDAAIEQEIKNALKKGSHAFFGFLGGLLGKEKKGGLNEKTQKLLIRAKRVLMPKQNVKISVTQTSIANTTISDAHPVWYSQEALKATGSTAQAHWEHLENIIGAQISAGITKDSSKTVYYDPRTAYRILFFEELKTNATSPKVETSDAYNQKWKIKWGDEVQPEVIANRLYVAVGGKINDLNYNPKAGELILVLPATAGKKAADDCIPTNADELAKCLLGSSYNYNIKPNILKTGVIDDAVFQEMAAHLPLHEKTLEQWKKEVKGRRYVKFREALVELNAKKALVKGGAADFSSRVAQADRVGRSLVLFNMWVGNRDAKDDNNKAYLMKLPKGATAIPGLMPVNGEVYLETQHDLGHTFGQIFAAGEIASMKGREFITTDCGVLNSADICFDEGMLYVPEAWRKATVSDLVFMGRYIVNFMSPYMKGAALNKESDRDLYWIMSQANWPEFMKLALMSKLVERTIGVVQVLNEVGDTQLGLAKDFRSFTPSYVATTQNMIDLANAYGLDMQKMKSFANNDIVVVTGVLARCDSPQENPLIDFLQRERFPSGLWKRISRLNDNQESSGCDSVKATIQNLIKK